MRASRNKWAGEIEDIRKEWQEKLDNAHKEHSSGQRGMYGKLQGKQQSAAMKSPIVLARAGKRTHLFWSIGDWSGQWQRL